jgi:TPR repeat protein
VFRVEGAPGKTAALEQNGAAPLRQMALTDQDQPQTAVTSASSPLMARAMRLLGDGDIAAARPLFQRLADQGESEAAYELARTFDAQALNELGARGIGADRTRALSWYERASETGSSKAAERLKILASLAN